MVPHAQKALESYDICATSCCLDRILSGSLKMGTACNMAVKVAASSPQGLPEALFYEKPSQEATGLCARCRLCEAARRPPPPGRTGGRVCFSPCQAISPSVP